MTDLVNPCDACPTKSDEYSCDCSQYAEYCSRVELQESRYTALASIITQLQMMGYKIIIDDFEIKLYQYVPIPNANAEDLFKLNYVKTYSTHEKDIRETIDALLALCNLYE